MDVPDVSLKARNELHIRQRLRQDYDSQEWREYKYDNPKRGRAVIANFYSFKASEATREGSDKDVSRLKQTLGDKLKFDVITWDLTGIDEGEFMAKVKEEADKKEHLDGDCFVMVIMTHGDQGGVLKAYDKHFQLDKVVDCFTGDKCRALRRKPKIFIVQACRGRQGHSGMYVAKSMPKNKPAAEMITLPTHSDILIGQAQYEGYYSLRNPREGSYFIQSFCDVLDSDFQKPDDKKDDLLRLLTFVSHMVANFEFMEVKKSKNPGCTPTDQAAVGDVQDGVKEQDDEPLEGCELGQTLGRDAKPFNPTTEPQKPTIDDARLVKQQPTVVSTLLQLFYLRNKDIEKKQDN